MVPSALNMNPARLFFPPKVLLALCALLVASPVYSQTQGYNLNYVIINNTYYEMYDNGNNGSNLTSIQGLDLGSFNPSAGQTLTLNGFEANTFQNSGANVYQTFGAWAVTPQGTTATTFNTGEIGFNNASGNLNKKFNNTLFGVNLLSGLSNGTYTLSLYQYANASFNNGSPYQIYDSRDGANYTATFTVVPEPSTYAAGALAFAAIAFMQRRRFGRLLAQRKTS